MGRSTSTRRPDLTSPTSRSEGMLSKQLWATGLSLAVIAMMGAPAGALPG